MLTSVPITDAYWTDSIGKTPRTNTNTKSARFSLRDFPSRSLDFSVIVSNLSVFSFNRSTPNINFIPSFLSSCLLINHFSSSARQRREKQFSALTCSEILKTSLAEIKVVFREIFLRVFSESLCLSTSVSGEIETGCFIVWHFFLIELAFSSLRKSEIFCVFVWSKFVVDREIIQKAGRKQ